MESRYLGFADRRLLVEYPPAFERIINFLFVNVPSGMDQKPDHTFTVVPQQSGTCTLLKDKEKIGDTADDTTMANLLMGEIIYAMIDGVHSGLTLHAAAVAWKNKGIWMPGTSGAGKSSLSAWFVSHGYTYLTDELIHCPFGGLSFETFIRPLNFKKHGLSAITALLPENKLEDSMLASEAVTMVQPGVFGRNDPASTPKLSLLLFPAFERDAALAIEPLSPAQAGLQLMGCHVNARNLPMHGFPKVVSLCKKVPACRLTYGSFNQLTGTLDTFLDLLLECNLTKKQLKQLAKLASSSSKDLVRNEEQQLKKTIPKPTPKGKKRKLTIGMATYDDYDGVYFSAQAIGLYHSEVRDDIEILVIDNHPKGKAADSLKKLETLGNYRYVPFGEKTGPFVKDRIFEEAGSDYVLCMDSHVLIVPGALARLIAYFEKHPLCNDLLQGPLINDNLSSMYTHFAKTWRTGMYGVWEYDNRADNENNEPFDIPMQGCGLFACRKAAWPGFHPDFRGFGGEEGYIHEKFRRAGGRTLCLPFLRWLHRFDRPGGVPYTVDWQDRIWNYMIGFQELGLDTEQVIHHFNEHLGKQVTTDILRRLQLAGQDR